MMNPDFIWLVALIITHVCAYVMGKEDGRREGGGLSEEAQIEIEKYKIDQEFGFYAWLEERRGKHE